VWTLNPYLQKIGTEGVPFKWSPTGPLELLASIEPLPMIVKVAELNKPMQKTNRLVDSGFKRSVRDSG
jgi:hypothetical protein